VDLELKGKVAIVTGASAGIGRAIATGLAAEGVNLENGFLQLNRLLAGNPDKKSNLRVVRKLAGRYPQLAQAHFAIAQAAAAADDEPAALAAIRQAAALRPDWELAALFEAQVLQKRSTAAAAKRLGDFVERNPDSREARMNYARALVLDKRFPEARKQFEAVLAAHPGNTEVIYAVGLLAFQLKDYPVAEENMKRLLGMGYRDANGVRYLLGQMAEEQKQWPDAIKWYDGIKDGDHVLPARMRTAGAIAKQGKLDEARAFLKRVSADHPDEQVQLLVAEAQLLREANRHGDAFDLLGEALAKEPEQPELLYDLALTAEKLERYDLLESHLRKLIQVKPDHAHAYNALGYSFAERNTRLPEARKLIEKALEISPEDYFIIDSLGWVQYREGDLRGAAETLRRAYTGRPDAEIGAHLGEVLWQLGEREEADRVWQESLKASPENETLRKSIKRRRESIEMYTKGARQDLADKESAEAAALEKYLPAQVSDAELRAAVKAAIAGGATQIGAVMGKVLPQFKGRADGGTINAIAREELSKQG